MRKNFPMCWRFVGNLGRDNSECGECFAEKLDARYLESPMQVLKTVASLKPFLRIKIKGQSSDKGSQTANSGFLNRKLFC